MVPEAGALPRTVGPGSRRYLGCKSGLLGFIRQTVERQVGPPASVLDLFAGTGVVAGAFNRPDCPVTAVDILESNRVCLNTFLGPGSIRADELKSAVETLNRLPGRPGYVRQTFGGLYFSAGHASRIDAARQWIRDQAFQGRLRDALVASVLLGADRVARTCGHYDAFRRRAEPPPALVFPLPDLPSDGYNRGNRVLHGEAEQLAGELPCDLAYLDPPYNSRQYSDLYHVLENIALWSKPPVEGKARKMDRRGLKSRFNVRAAPQALGSVIRSLRCRTIVLSYSNMGRKGDSRSNARISDAQILRMLEARGRVHVFQTDHRPFSAGRRSIRDHRERLFVCEVET